MIDQGLAAMNASAGSIALLSEDGTTLEVCRAIGYPAEVVESWRRFPIDADVPLAEAVRTAELVLLESAAQKKDRYPNLASTESTSAALAAIPLLLDGRAIGALGLSFDKPVIFPPGARAFMLVLAQQCAQALERARLYEAERAAREGAGRAQERLAFLAEASQILSSSLDYRETLTKISRLVIPRLADWCVIEVAEGDHSTRQLAIAHVDESKEEVARELLRRYPPDRNAPIGVPRVMRTGRSEIYPRIDDSLLEKSAQDAEHLEILKSLDLRSAMVVPLRARGRTLGAITFVSSKPGRFYGEDDLSLAEDLARRAALAMDNALLFQETDESKERFAYLARALQESLLPPRIEGIPGIESAVRYRPAAEGNQVGGDFYDLFQVAEGDWGIVVGDVCGKGARAAALTGLARHTIRAVALREPDPVTILGMLNQAIIKESEGNHSPQFCTVAYARLQPLEEGARLTISCGGHPLPYVVRADGSVERAGTPGMLLGLFPDADINAHQIELASGDAAFFYTDGVTDERRGKEIFGDERLKRVLRESAGSSADAMADSIEQAVLEFSGGDSSDDIAILVLRVSSTGSRTN